MAGPSIGQARPRGRTAAGTTNSASLVSTFVVLLALGLALRLIIAYVLLPGSGFGSDLASFQGWADGLVSQGSVGFYSKPGFLDYPPVYLLLLDALGHVVAFADGLLRGAPFVGGLIPQGNGVGETIKLIPIVADVVLAIVVRKMARELGASDRRATIAALVIVVNPVTWFNSAIWGQADAVGAVIMLLSLRELIKDRRESAAALAVLATLTKVQLGIVGFLVVFVILRRSAAPRSGAADPMRILTSGAAGLLTAALVCLPFTGLDFAGLGQRLGSAAGLLTMAAGLVAGAGVFVLAYRALTDGDGGEEYGEDTGTPAPLVPTTTGEGAIEDLGEAGAAAEPGPGLQRQLRLPIALGFAVISAVVFAGMAFDSIASHIINTFGEYPYLTLNAYNPWVLAATSTGESMARTLSWIHDAPWLDSNSSGPGYLIGFSIAGKTLAIAVVALLGVGAVVTWNWARAFRVPAAAIPPGLNSGSAGDFDPERDESAGSSGLDLDAEPDWGPEFSAGPLPAGGSFSEAALAVWPNEFRALAVGFGLVAVALGALVVAQSFGPISAAIVGDVALLAVLVGVSLWAAWRDDPLSLVVALAILSIAFFALPTRSHERYLFPFFGVGAVLLALSWRWRLAYVILAVANMINLLAVLVQYGGIPDYSTTWATTNPGATAGSSALAGLLIGWGHFLETATWFDGIIWPIALVGVVVGLALVWSLLQLRTRAVDGLAEEALASGSESAAPGLWGGDLAGESAFGATPRASVSGASVSGSFPGQIVDLVPAEFEPGPADFVLPDEQPQFVPSRVMRMWRRVYRRPALPDRSAALKTEPRGRLDKLDLWLVALLVVATLSLRVYRLGEPLQMHFDEVYHARTATEFLQDWRYDIPHTIYEWTHPDLAKYAIAGGLVLFADDKVTATSELGVDVKAAVVQPRIVPGSAGYSSNPDASGSALTSPDARLGDRIYVVASDSVRVYDLQTRALITTFQIPGASAVSLDVNHNLFVGTTSGRIFELDTVSLDEVRLGLAKAPTAPVELTAAAGFPITKIYAGSPALVLAVGATGDIVSIDTSIAGGQVVGTGNVPAAADFVSLDSRASVLVFNPANAASGTPSASPSATATPSSSPSQSPSATTIEAEASALAKALATDPIQAKALLSNPSLVLNALHDSAASDVEKALALPPLDSDARAAVQKLIDGGDLPGISVSVDVPQVVVAYRDGVGLMDARHIRLESTVATDEPATSIAFRTDDTIGSQDSYVAAGKSIVLVRISTSAGTLDLSPGQPLKNIVAPVSQVYFDEATRIVHALGKTPDGAGWTVYAIETNGDAMFSDAKLPFQPVALGADVTPQLPNTDREQLLAISADGGVASVDIGQFSFAWRIIGVLFGVLMAACLFLLARLLFRRRSVGVLVALFSIVDGMFFVQSRIAMNDTYVGAFLLLAYLLFALLWLGVWKNRAAFWVVMPIIGVILGLALASKWVALYAMASIGILVLIRSALGRLVTILGLAAGTGVLGWMAIAEMSTATGTGNLPAMAILALLAVGVAWFGITWALGARTTPDRVLIGTITAVLTAGVLALSVTFLPQPIQFGAPNYTYFLVMLAVTSIAAAANAYHPVSWSREEFWFATAGPIVVGAFLALLGGLRGSHALELAGAGGVGLGVAAAGAFWLGGRYGFGPLAGLAAAPELAPGAPGEVSGDSVPEPASPAPTGWLRLGTGWGLPAIWMVASLLVIPIAVYVASYVPWAMPWQPQTALASTEYQAFGLPVIYCPDPDQNGNCIKGDGWPNGHTGKTLFQQTIEMYNYHNDLRSGHPASSPWWAWPMDLKPVWFENANYAGSTATNIYDGGNPVLWWMAIVAMGFICWQAFKRRSLGLTLITVAFFWQWISWTRIDRASFQYHFYTALPFFLLALAYFIAELWHGPSRRTWLLARVAAAIALMFPTLLWLLKEPVCGLARVQLIDLYTNSACGSTSGDLRVETRIAMIAVVLVAALVALGAVLLRLERRQSEGREERGWILQLIVPVIIAGVLLLWVGQSGPRDLLFDVPVPSDLVVLILLPFFAVLAYVALTAVDPRRFVLGFCAVAVVVFIAFYPNLSALPMPSTIVNVYQGLLPTWLYGFEFSVNQQVSSSVHLVSADTIGLSVATLAVAGMVAYLAWRQRVGYGPRPVLASPSPDDGNGGDEPSSPADPLAPEPTEPAELAEPAEPAEPRSPGPQP